MRLPRSVLLASLLAAACSDTRRPATAPLQPSVRITPENATAVAASAYRTAFGPAHAARIVTSLLELPPAPQAAVAGGGRVSVFDGPQGGTATCTWFDRDGDEKYSDGDSLTVGLADFGRDGRVYTGWAFLDDLQVQGNPVTASTYVAATPLRFRNLRVALGGASDFVNGSFACTREKRQTVTIVAVDPVAETYVGAAKLRPGSSIGRNDYLIDFSMGLFADGSFDDPVLGGTLTFRSEPPMTGFQFLPDPGTGEFTVAGSDGSNLLVTPIDYFNIEIRVDADGDGEFEATIATEWAALAQ